MMANPQTPALYDQAVDKIRDEMDATKDPAVQAVGEIMTLRLRAHPEDARAVAAAGKTLQGAYKAMEDYARKNRGGASCVCVPPARAETLILGYFGLDAEPAPVPARSDTPAPDDDFDLDALLGV